MKEALENLRIGSVAKRTGLSIHTIRYYEKEGLLEKAPRSSGGFRHYRPETVERLAFIQKAKEFGLTLGEIKRITCCGDMGLGPCCDMAVKLFTKKERELGEKIQDLHRTKRKVRGLLSGWAGKERHLYREDAKSAKKGKNRLGRKKRAYKTS